MASVEDITVCPICQNIYTDPKMLPCLHNFCRKCLETSATDQHGTEVQSTGVQSTNGQSTKSENTDDQSSTNLDIHDQSLGGQSTDVESTNGQSTRRPSTVEPNTRRRGTCKICQSEYAIPAGGFSSLPNNAFVKQLTVFANLSRPDSERLCEICPAARNSVSRIYCIDCGQAMCDECKESHWRARVSQNHKSLVFGSQLEPDVMRDRNCYCELHPYHVLAMYCRDHKMTICFECAAVDHRNDNCAPLSKVTEPFVSQLNDDLKKLNRRVGECKEATAKLDEIESSLKREVNNTEESIDKYVAECIAFINKAGGTLRETEQLEKQKSKRHRD